MELTEEQKKLKEYFLFYLLGDSKYLVIDGQGGTGKTYLLASLLETISTDLKSYATLLDKKADYDNVYITSTTNKSCQAIRDQLPYDTNDVCTIHKLLGLRVKENTKTGDVSLSPKFGGVHDIKDSIIFIDECSMINEELFSYINNHTMGSKVIFIGDKYQLPPVKTNLGAVYKYNFDEKSLTQIIRSKNDDLVQACTELRNCVKDGSMVKITPSEHVIYLDDRDQATLDWIKQTFSHEGNDRILGYTNNTVTQYIQIVNQIKGYSNLFNLGQKCIVNDNVHAEERVLEPEKEVRIAQIGTVDTDNVGKLSFDYTNLVVKDNFGVDSTIQAINNYESFKKVLNYFAKEKNWGMYFIYKNNFCDLRSTEVSTVHKAQGSTFDNVLIDLTDLSTCTQGDLFRKLLYVAFSRARYNVYLTGSLSKRFGEIIL